MTRKYGWAYIGLRGNIDSNYNESGTENARSITTILALYLSIYLSIPATKTQPTKTPPSSSTVEYVLRNESSKTPPNIPIY